MNNQLAQLISDYQAAVNFSILQMSKSGIEIPSSNTEWLELNIPAHGELKDGIRYFKHGFGCCIYLPEGEVDFDFGEKGEIDGIDEWRLWNFSQKRSKSYGFDTMQALAKCIFNAFENGTLVAQTPTFCHVVDSVKLLGSKVAATLTTGCGLPHWNHDSIQMLSSQCFASADLMLEHYRSIDALWTKNGELNSSNSLKLRVYLLSWLGYLNTTIEGFENINIWLLLKHKRPTKFQELTTKCGEIGKLVKRHANDLRRLRNDTFHLRNDNDAITRFFSDDGERLEWAKELHAAFDSFFSEYRSLAETYYIINGRYGESQIRQEGKRRKKKRMEKAATKLKAETIAQ